MNNTRNSKIKTKLTPVCGKCNYNKKPPLKIIKIFFKFKIFIEI